jgi:hypothetical protein
MKLFIIMQHAPGNLVFIIEFVLGYTTRRWTSSAKIKERLYRSHLSRLGRAPTEVTWRMIWQVIWHVPRKKPPF